MDLFALQIGKGNHALVSGHGKSQGDVLFYPNGHQFGTVNVSLQPTLQPNVGDNWCDFYTDVALVRLDEQAGYIPQVLDGILNPLGLNERPTDATNGMSVRRFSWDGRKGRIDSKCYNILDDAYNIAFRLISVVRDDGGPMHAEGDSGILIATDTPVNGKVNAVGILVRLELMYEDNEEQTVRVTSLAVPLPANFDALRSHSYCNGKNIKFLN